MDYSVTLTESQARDPQILGMLSVRETRHHRKILKTAVLGYVDSESAEEEDPILIDLQEMCSLHGHEPKDESRIAHYSNPFYLCGAGSIVPHKDTGLGLTANVLVSIKDLSRTYQSEDDCVLFAQGKHINIKVGHVFLLDTNVEHAWIANCKWLIIGQAIETRKGS